MAILKLQKTVQKAKQNEEFLHNLDLVYLKPIVVLR